MARHIPAGLVLLMGAPGSGKSTFAGSLVATGQVGPDAVVSTDALRGALNGDPADQTNAAQVFAHRDRIVSARLRAGRTTVVDATNLSRRAGPLAEARRNATPVSVVRFATPLDVCLARNTARERVVPTDVLVDFHARHDATTDEALVREGVDAVFTLDGSGHYGGLVLLPEPERPDATHLHGPFDIVGDVHGQIDAFDRLTERLGYDDLVHPDGRLLVLVGDVVDKGPEPLAALRRVMDAHRRGRVLMVRGNHEAKLARVLVRAMREADGSTGRMVKALGVEARKAKWGLARTLEQLRRAEDFEELAPEVVRFVSRLPLHLVLDGGRLVVVHASIRPELVGLEPAALPGGARRDLERSCIYGPTTGGRDAAGRPVRVDFADTYEGTALVVRGHHTVEVPSVHNRVVSVDSGAGDGRSLSAFSYPEAAFTTVGCSAQD